MKSLILIITISSIIRYMFEREPQFKRPEQETVKPLERLRESIKDMSLELRGEGVPVDDNARIDPEKFTDIYSKQSIESDKAWVEDLKGRWERSANIKGSVFPQKQSMGEAWEMLATSILHRNLGKDFIVARTSEYDDARYKVDNIILDKKTGHIVCAFDEVEATSGTIFEEKRNNVLKRNWERGGTDLKYGIFLEDKTGRMKLEKGSVFQIPLFYAALSEGDLKRTLADPSQEKEVFKSFVESTKKQIGEIRKGPLHPKLKTRLDFFEKQVIEKF